ncbi:MAG: hypothetical protein NT069_01040, partial [Planctomycetota bacterium]|nr:hypothetical protein [Planctomycetota bacterium]
AAPAKKTLLDDSIFAKGLKRTGEFSGGIGPGAGRYFLWSVERVGVLLALEKIGEVNWFATGSAGLLKDQKEDGSWPTAWVDTDKDSLSDTCFALLFLRRANLGSDISRLLEGEYEDKFEITSRTPVARFGKITDAVAAAHPGETIRIMGNGPWRVGHLELDKDITIQAGHGFAPVFKFEVGRNKKGLRYKPETEPEGRDMIAVRGGQVTIEGLRLQMDPGKDTKKVPWSIVTVDGGELRLLNCSLTETSQQGTSGVSWRSPGMLVARNCQMMGGRTAIEVSGHGDQELVVDNTLLFSTSGVSLVAAKSDAVGAKFKLRSRHSVFHTKEAIACADSHSEIDIDAETTVFQSEWISQNLLRDGKDSKAGRNWKGELNVYDVKQWIGTAGKSANIKDSREWIKFWGGAEKDSFKRTAPFVGTRRLGSFSHDANIQDWLLEFPSSAEAPLQRGRVGINNYVAGPGIGYDQYRETIGYSYWKRNRLELSDRRELLPRVAGR